MDRAYTASSRAFSAAIALLGVAMIVTTLVRGGGPLALGMVLGVLFAALGVARLWLASVGARRGR